MADLSLCARRRLFAALLTLPLAAAFSSTSLLFLPGALWDQDQRLVSSMGQDATATTWAVTCTSTSKCDLPSSYLVYTLGESTAHWSQTDTAPIYDMTCAITPPTAAACSGHVSGVAFATAWNAAFLSSYVYRQVTVTDYLGPVTSTSTSTSRGSSGLTTAGLSSTGTGALGAQTTSGVRTTASVVGPTGINSGILNSYDGGSGSGGGGTSTSSSTRTSVGKQSAAGGLGGTGTSKSKAAAPMVTGMLGEMGMGMMAAAAVVGGAVGF